MRALLADSRMWSIMLEQAQDTYIYDTYKIGHSQICKDSETGEEQLLCRIQVFLQ